MYVAITTHTTHNNLALPHNGHMQCNWLGLLVSESISSLFGAQRLESISGKTFGHGIRYVVEYRNLANVKSLLGDTVLDNVI